MIDTYCIEALSIGITLGEFRHLNPSKLELYVQAYKQRKERELDEQNALLHLQGQYLMEAISSTIENRMRGKGESIHKYPKEPFKLNNSLNGKNMSEYEKQRAVDKFFAEQDAMRVNFRRSKNK